MTIKILFVTGNKNKLAEAKQILGDKFEVDNIDIDLPEIQTTSVREVMEYKIKFAYEEASKIHGKNINIICEDTGLSFANMNNFPGALIKFYFKALGNEGIVQHNKGSESTATTVIGLHNRDGTYFFEGITNGTVPIRVPKVESFGWDPIFIPKLDGRNRNHNRYQGKTYAEIPIEVKNKISQRSKAFEKLKKYFIKN